MLMRLLNVVSATATAEEQC